MFDEKDRPLAHFEYLDFEMDMALKKQPLQQIFRNWTTQIGMHGNNNPYVLECHMETIESNIAKVKDGSHPIYKYWKQDMQSYWDFQLGVLMQYKSEMYATRTNLCNIIFSEN